MRLPSIDPVRLLEPGLESQVDSKQQRRMMTASPASDDMGGTAGKHLHYSRVTDMIKGQGLACFGGI